MTGNSSSSTPRRTDSLCGCTATSARLLALVGAPSSLGSSRYSIYAGSSRETCGLPRAGLFSRRDRRKRPRSRVALKQSAVGAIPSAVLKACATPLVLLRPQDPQPDEPSIGATRFLTLQKLIAEMHRLRIETIEMSMPISGQHRRK
jgi:hypothetical protein